MKTRTFLVTGANRGLGRAAAEKLARAGHHLVLAARDPRALARAADELSAIAPGCAADTAVCDLASFASVRACAAQLRGSALDGLLNNAGVMQQSVLRRATVDGLEETLHTNVLGPFLLTRLLLPSLARAGRARVVNVSSRLHMPRSRGAPVRFDFADPQLERGYDPERAYKNSKLAVLWFTYELARRLAPGGPTCVAICPGFVPATAADSTTGVQRFLLRRVLVHAPFATTVDDAASAFFEALTSPELEGKTGIFLADHREQPSSPESYEQQKARDFWALASALVGLPDAL